MVNALFCSFQFAKLVSSICSYECFVQPKKINLFSPARIPASRLRSPNHDTSQYDTNTSISSSLLPRPSHSNNYKTDTLFSSSTPIIREHHESPTDTGTYVNRMKEETESSFRSFFEQEKVHTIKIIIL